MSTLGEFVGKLGRVGLQATVGVTAGALAQVAGLGGGVFDLFGRTLGIKMLLQGHHIGAQLVSRPVASFRYFEFPFVRFALEEFARDSADDTGGGRRGGNGWGSRGSSDLHCLDVGSPFLFSLFARSVGLASTVDIVNPDHGDVQLALLAARVLGLHGVETHTTTIQSFGAQAKAGAYDAIWSISVVEHVPGEDGDVEAVRAMWRLLKPGGLLVLTVPVARRFTIQRSGTDAYGLGLAPDEEGLYFFQRLYDLSALHERIVDTVEVRPMHMRWFGERTEGTYRRYFDAWSQGRDLLPITDPIRMLLQYRAFASWADMPGLGVCGLVLRKDE